MNDLQIHLFGWWLLIPALSLAVLIYCANRWRWRAAFILAILSMAIMGTTVIMLFLSWSAIYQVFISWENPQGNGAIHYWGVGLRSNGGGVNLLLNTAEDTHPALSTNGPAIILFAHGPAGSFHGYPIWGDKYSVTKSDFVQKTLGFQLCWAPNLPASPSTGAWIAMYSITVPHWFILLLCPIFPLVWLRRFLRHRHRLRNNLCPTCGYDMRASTDRCPECGRAIAAKTAG